MLEYVVPNLKTSGLPWALFGKSMYVKLVEQNHGNPSHLEGYIQVHFSQYKLIRTQDQRIHKNPDTIFKIYKININEK